MNDDFFRIGDDEIVRDELLQAIVAYERDRPRSKQKAIGPSQAGAACARRLAYQMADTPALNIGGDPLPSIVGVAMHREMQDVMEWENARLGRQKWLIESKVLEPIAGTCDLFDTERGLVVDWKFPGPTMFKHYREAKRKGEPPSPEYDSQIDLYGLGMENLGYRVNHVGIMFIPRAGRMPDSFMYYREYDHNHAVQVAQRNSNIRKLVDAFDIEHHPERAEYIPRSPSDSCRYCPWFNPIADETGSGCCGFVC